MVVLAAGFDVVNDVTDLLDELASHWWFLGVIFVIALLDSIIPIAPSETAVIVGGVAAGQGNQQLWLVILAGAVGAFCGDHTAYFIGHKLSGPVTRLATRREKWEGRLDWAERQIRRRGGGLLITARFIPGGRTALTVSAGITHQPLGWFARWIAIAATLWATYAALLGYVFGKQFEDNHTIAFVVAFAAALSITLLLELVRHFRTKRAEARAGEAETEVSV